MLKSMLSLRKEVETKQQKFAKAGKLNSNSFSKAPVRSLTTAMMPGLSRRQTVVQRGAPEPEVPN